MFAIGDALQNLSILFHVPRDLADNGIALFTWKLWGSQKIRNGCVISGYITTPQK
jgi:hypothetical protein